MIVFDEAVQSIEEAAKKDEALKGIELSHSDETCKVVMTGTAEQLEKAYREMIDAVEVVADRMDIDIVYRFIPTSEAFEAENPEQAMMAIRLRTALRYPEQLDITDAVLEEMSLEAE